MTSYTNTVALECITVKVERLVMHFVVPLFGHTMHTALIYFIYYLIISALNLFISLLLMRINNAEECALQ